VRIQRRQQNQAGLPVSASTLEKAAPAEAILIETLALVVVGEGWKKLAESCRA
jgi:hypothetical protein